MNPKGQLRVRVFELLQAAGKSGMPCAWIIREIQKEKPARSAHAVQVTVSNMKTVFEIVEIGRAEHGVYPGIPLKSKIYAVPGTPLLPGAMIVRPPIIRRSVSRRGGRGSGVIAGPPYATGLRWGGVRTL